MNHLIPSKDEYLVLDAIVKNASQSDYFKNLGGYTGIFSIAMYARELGLPVMQCLFGGMTNINGRITLSANIMNMMIRKAGHQILQVESSNEKCILKGIRADTAEEMEECFTIEDARLAKLHTKNNWINYPRDMCFARALSRLARRLFPDVIGTAYVEGEIPSDDESKKIFNGTTLDQSIDVNKVIDLADNQQKAMSEEDRIMEIFYEETKELDQDLIKMMIDNYVSLREGNDKMNFIKYWINNPEKGMNHYETCKNNLSTRAS